MLFFEKNIRQIFANSKKVSTFASAIEKQTLEKRKRNGNVSPNDGPFVYRLGRKIFILERGVRFPHGLQLKE